MRSFFAVMLLLLTFALTSCLQYAPEPLAYQQTKFSARVDFSVDGESLSGIVEVLPGEGGYARLELEEPLIKGIAFKFFEGGAMIEYNGLSIPTAIERVPGICELLSLFFIDADDFYEQLESDEGTIYRFTNGDSGEGYELLLTAQLPKRITLTCGERVIIAEIDEFLAE